MDRHNSLVQEIRDLWSCAGVEVESVSGNKVRCRMPPYFKGVEEFVDSLEPWGAEIDLETTVNAGAASVTFVVFGDPRAIHGNVSGDTKPKSRVALNGTVYLVLLLACLVVQILNFFGGAETFARVAGKLYNKTLG